MTPSQYQGYLGEHALKKFYESQGYTVITNPHRHGPWDMIVFKPNEMPITIQVKTLTRYIKENYFSITDGPNQQTIENAKKCDKLIIVVKKPNHKTVKEDPEFQGKILEIQNHKERVVYNNQMIIKTNDPKNYKELGYITKEFQEKINAIKIPINRKEYSKNNKQGTTAYFHY